MNEEHLSFLQDLLETPSPTGRIEVSNSSICFNVYKYSRIRSWIVRSRRSTA